MREPVCLFKTKLLSQLIMACMDVFFQIASLALLVIIVVQLHLLTKAASHGQRQSLSEEERTGRQTINVNVGLPGIAADKSLVTQTDTKADEPAAQDDDAKDIAAKTEEINRPAPVIAAPRPNSRATVSGISAVKCSSCGAENSSYRRECFNCGKAI